MTTATAARILEGLAPLGFGTDVPKEASPLVRAGAAVLWKRLETGTVKGELVCVVDRPEEASPGFAMDGARLAAVASECGALVGRTMGFVQNRLRITIVEIASVPLSAAERARLEELVWGTSDATAVEVLYLTANGAEVWARRSDDHVPPLAPLLVALARGEEVAPAGVATAPSPPTARAVARALRSGPVATYALMALITIAFAVEALAARSLDPDAEILYALGGMSARGAREHGEWGRLLSASLLHGDLTHLLLNGVALLLGGAIVEMLIGRRWLFVIYVASAAGGSALGMVVNRSNIVSVGASGAIMGLLAAGFVLAFRIPDARERSHLLGQLARWLVPSLVPLAMSARGGQIDYAAHAGGALAGVLVGGCLILAVRFGGKERPAPRLATALAVALGLVYAGSALAAARRFSDLAPSARLKAGDVLVKDDAIPKDPKARKDEVEQWGKDRERDPRVHLFRALRQIDAEDLPGAEREARAGLAETEVLAKFFGDRRLETQLRAVLCSVLLDEDRRADAVAEARPVCDAGDGGTVPDVLARLALCEQR